MAKKYIIGIDEVGRGPLAGPITVGAVAMAAASRGNILKGIKDSKKLPPVWREEWAKKMHSAPFLLTAVSSVGAGIIDKIGITASARLAVGRCLIKLKKAAIPGSKFVIQLDGSLYAPKTYQNQETIIKGDEKIPLIAAASIIAKVKRDKMMVRLHDKFPQYGFDAHKGYGTKAHKSAIRQYGLSPVHRKSFRV